MRGLVRLNKLSKFTIGNVSSKFKTVWSDQIFLEHSANANKRQDLVDLTFMRDILFHFSLFFIFHLLYYLL